MAITIQPQSNWPVPYIDRATISGGGIEGRCNNCRHIKLIYFFYVGRNVAKGPKHGGWYDGNHDMECSDCIDSFLSERAETCSIIVDERAKRQ